MQIIHDIIELTELIDSVDVVIFDLDDTLYSEKEYVRSGYRAIAKEFTQIENMESKLWNAFLRKEQAIDSVLKSEGFYSEENLRLCLDTYRTHFPDIHVYKGVKELFTNIKARRKKMGMITDGRPEGQWNKIRALNLEDSFDRIIVTDELGDITFRKPCPVAFQLLRQFFETEYCRMIYVGDNPRKDFIAPEQLGMNAVWFCNPDGLYYTPMIK